MHDVMEISCQIQLRWSWWFRVGVLLNHLFCMQEVPENKRRVSLLRGIVISRRNAGINTTFRVRRVMAGVGVEIVFPL